MAHRTEPPLSEAALILVAERFAALADASRLRILNVLMQGERPVLDLVAETGLSQTNVSRHLAVLRRAGLVARRAEGTLAIYRVTDPTIEKLCRLVCGSLAERLEGDLDALAPRRSRR